MITLRKISEDASTITLGWDKVEGADGFRFTAEKQPKPSHTWNGDRTSVRFAKGSAWYRVEAMNVQDQGEWPLQATQPAPPVGPFQVRDGMGTVTAFPDCFVRTAASTVIEKKHVMNVKGYGIGSMQYDYANNTPPPGRTTIRDCISENVRASPSGSMGGTGEANFWIGNPTTAQRLVARKSGWMAFFIGARSQGSLLEDVLIEDVPVGLYFELATHDVVVRRLETKNIKAQVVAGGTEPGGILAARSGTKEWWHRTPEYGLTGPYNITYEDSVIYCPPRDPRFEFDPSCGDYNGPGCGGMRYLNCLFFGPGAATMQPRVRAQNLPEPFFDDRCQFMQQGPKIIWHDLPMGG